MSADRSDSTAFDAPLGRLERALIDEFLRARGCDPLALSKLPKQERETLLKGASMYASTKLAEIESRSQFLHELHDGVTSVPKPAL
jgi:hypothetical protein